MNELSPPPAGSHPLWLLDGEAFLLTVAGGLHASTRMLLELLAERQAELASEDGPATVLDFGCGSGVLGLAALRLGGPRLRGHATDVSATALECAKRNAQLNGLSDQLELWLPWELPSRVKADLAVANMLAGPLISVAAEIASRVAPGGQVLLSGFQSADVSAVRTAFGAYFDLYASPIRESEDGWLVCSGVRNCDDVAARDRSADAVQ